jgi:putative peptide zinc metalloprotease protein
VTRRLAAVAAAVLLLLMPAAPASAQGGDTAAIAINTKDGADVFKLVFQIRRVTQDVVDTGNYAIAYASCTDCQTVAIAIQIVLVSGYDSGTVAPENLAIAINENCVLCDTLASAYQFVVTAEGNLRFTPQGRRRLADLRKALHDLRKADLTGPEIQARLDGLMDELADILSTELVEAGPPEKAPRATPTATPTAVPSSAEPPESAAPASETPSPSEPPSATAEPTAEPTASETVAP